MSAAFFACMLLLSPAVTYRTHIVSWPGTHSQTDTQTVFIFFFALGVRY